MKKSIKTTLVLSVILLFALMQFSCSLVRVVNTDTYPGFALANFKTFDFCYFTGDSSIQKAYPQRIEWIKKEISGQLVNRGLTQSQNPDLLINIGIVVEDKVQTRQTNLDTDAPVYYGQRNYQWESEEVAIDRYKEGMISIDLVDREKNSLVWQGLVKSILVKKDEGSKKNIAQGVQLLFDEIP